MGRILATGERGKQGLQVVILGIWGWEKYGKML